MTHTSYPSSPVTKEHHGDLSYLKSCCATETDEECGGWAQGGGRGEKSSSFLREGISLQFEKRSEI